MELIKLVCFLKREKKLKYFEMILLVQYDECLRSRLEQFSLDQIDMNTIFNHEPIHYGEIVSLPFTGIILYEIRVFLFINPFF